MERLAATSDRPETRILRIRKTKKPHRRRHRPEMLPGLSACASKLDPKPNRAIVLKWPAFDTCRLRTGVWYSLSPLWSSRFPISGTPPWAQRQRRGLPYTHQHSSRHARIYIDIPSRPFRYAVPVAHISHLRRLRNSEKPHHFSLS